MECRLLAGHLVERLRRSRRLPGFASARSASDTGGSIRWPCAANGVTGLKPSWGRVSRHGVFELAATLDHVGTDGRSAADAGAMLGAIAGSDPNDPTAVLDPVPDYLAAAAQDVRGLRIGVDAAWNSDDVDAATQAVLSEATSVPLARRRHRRCQISRVTQAIADWTPNCAVEAAVAHEATYPARKDEYGPDARLGDRGRARAVRPRVSEDPAAAAGSARPRHRAVRDDRSAADPGASVPAADARHDTDAAASSRT